jgi:hypothetical protein
MSAKKKRCHVCGDVVEPATYGWMVYEEGRAQLLCRNCMADYYSEGLAELETEHDRWLAGVAAIVITVVSVMTLAGLIWWAAG